MNTRAKIIAGLLVLSGLGFAWLGKHWQEDGRFDEAPRNVLHLKQSPYGRTVAVAMRGPVDIYWHRGSTHDHGGGEHSHDEDSDHQHWFTELEDAEKPKTPSKPELTNHNQAQPLYLAPGNDGLRDFLIGHIKEMKTSYYSRTNHRADTKLHRAFVMGETQQRLRLSYEMDPANHTTYAAYFMFLSEALARVEGTDGEDAAIQRSRNRAMKLAAETLNHCAQYQDEAAAMITAASAAHDYFRLYIDQPSPNPKIARSILTALDRSLGHWHANRDRMVEDGRWDQIPKLRRTEMYDSYRLISKLRENDERLMALLEGGPQD